jgi:membrane protease YdiL (CAAX protease family)
MLLQELSLISAASLALWVATRVTGRCPRSISPSTPLSIVKGVFIGIGVGVVYAFTEILFLVPTKLSTESFLTLCTDLSRSLILLSILTQAIVAFWEERMWRGEILPTLQEKYRARYALLISSAGFGLWHLIGNANDNPFQIALVGLMCGSLFLVTRSLWAAMGLHFAHNVLNDVLGGAPEYRLPASPFYINLRPFEIQLFP